MSLLQSTRTKPGFLESNSTRSEGTRKLKLIAITNFDRFCMDLFNIPSSEPLIEEMIDAPNTQGTFDVLQKWIAWNAKRIAPQTILIYWVNLNDYLFYRGVKLDLRDIRHNLKFPKPLKESKHVLKLEEIQNICSVIKYNKKAMNLVLVSTGMRIGEALQIRKKHLNFDFDRVMICIPAEFTKTREARKTFMSYEAYNANKNIIDEKLPDDLIWGTNENTLYNVGHESQNFARYCKKAGYVERYSSGRRKITLHSFRSYFISRFSIKGEALGHAFSGHTGNMKQYDRFTDEELCEKYIEIEPELLVFDLVRKDNEIKRLKETNEEVEFLKEQLEGMKELLSMKVKGDKTND